MKEIKLKRQLRWVVRNFILLGMILGALFAFIMFPIGGAKADLNLPDITYYNVAGEEKAIMAYNLGATTTDIENEDSLGNNYLWGSNIPGTYNWGDVEGWEEGDRGPCTVGYHVPTINEWRNLLVQWCEDEKLCDTKSVSYILKSNDSDFGNTTRIYNPDDIYDSFSDKFNIPHLVENHRISSSQMCFDDGCSPVFLDNGQRDNGIGIFGDYDWIYYGGIRCFKDSANEDPIPLALDIYDNNGENLIDTIFVPEDQELPDSKKEKLSKYILYTENDDEIDIDTVVFTDDDADEGIITVYAECANGYEIEHRCAPFGIYYESGYIKLDDGENVMYIKDRNQGAEISLKTLYDRYEIDEEDYGYEYNTMSNDEDYVKTFGNWYFWGNNSGVSYSDFEIENGVIKNMETLQARGFNGGKVGDDNTGWEEGETDNPCNADEGEYLPILSDFFKAMDIRGEINGISNSDIYHYDGYLGYNLRYGQSFFNDILLPGGASQIFSWDGQPYHFGDSVGSLQTALDSGGSAWMFTSSEGEYYIEPGINNRAMPVRCFIDPAYIEEGNGNTNVNLVEPMTLEEFEVTIGNETYDDLPEIMEVTTNNEVEVEENKPVVGEVSVDFGENVTAKFNKLVQVNIPVEDYEDVIVKVKHAGSDEYNFDGLTLNRNATCNDNGRPTSSQYNGEIITVVDGYASIYTCEASSFIALGLGSGEAIGEVTLTLTAGENTCTLNDYNLGTHNVSSDDQNVSTSGQNIVCEFLKNPGATIQLSMGDLADGTKTIGRQYFTGIVSSLGNPLGTIANLTGGSYNFSLGHIIYTKEANTIGTWTGSLAIEGSIPAGTPGGQYTGELNVIICEGC